MASIMMKYPVIGIYVQQNAQNEWIVAKFEKEEKVRHLGIQQGDVVLLINGSAANENASIRSWRVISLAEDIVLSRNGVTYEVHTDTISKDYNTTIFPILCEILCIFMSILIYWKARSSKSAVMLSIVFINLAFIFMTLGGSVRGDPLAKICIGTSIAALPVVFLHFFRVFLGEKANIPYSIRLLRALYSIPVIIFILAMSFLFPSIAARTYSLVISTTIVAFIVGLVFLLIELGYTYYKYRKQSTYFSNVIRTVWVSLLASFSPFIILSFIPQLIYGTSEMDPYYSAEFILLFPLSFAYLILAKRLYDIDLIVRRSLITLVIAFVPSSMLVVLDIAVFRKDATLEKLIVDFLITLLTISIILYSLEYLTNRFEKSMFPRKHYLKQALKSMAGKISGIHNFQEMKETLLVDLLRTLEVGGCAIAMRFPDHLEIITAGTLDSGEVRRQLATHHLNKDRYTIFTISSHEEYDSYLIFTKKKNNTLLNKEENDWLDPILSNLSVSLENVYLIQKLTIRLHELAGQIPSEGTTDDLLWLRKAMFDIQEKERFRIALDIHDSTMQDIFLLKTRIEMFADREARSIEDSNDLQRYVDHLEIINQNLRNNCLELNPHLLREVGLFYTIEKWIDAEINDFEIEFTTRFKEEIESLELDVKKHLFRMIQELINNARKHSQAAKVDLKLTMLDGHICLMYKDNGKGFDMKRLSLGERLKTYGSSGLGMEQLKSRVWLLKGKLRIYSKPGRGVRVHIRVPVANLQLRMLQ
jgi:two-component system sensor histidine kinase ComP